MQFICRFSKHIKKGWIPFRKGTQPFLFYHEYFLILNAYDYSTVQ